MRKKVVSKAENLLDSVSAEDKEDIVALIEVIHRCIEDEDIVGMNKPVTELNDIIYYLES